MGKDLRENNQQLLMGQRKNEPPPTPKWVKTVGIVIGVLVLAIVIMHLAGGGFGSHMHS